jgi:hypothetical protein
LQGKGILIVKLMVLPEHEVPEPWFPFKFQMKIRQMGIIRELACFGAYRVEGRQLTKEPDAQLRLILIQKSQDAWPTLLMNCGL